MPAEAVKSLRLLVVEDAESDYGLLLHYLRRAGYALDADRVEDAQGLSRALEGGAWDLVISDHQLPGFSSREALALVRSHAGTLPFIIVSGTMGEAAAVDAMIAGADDYVVKGHYARLPTAIERSLAVAQARRTHAATEAAQKESEAKLSGIARNLPGALLQIGFDPASGAITLPFFTEGASALLGVEAAALRAAPDRFVRALHPEDRADFVLHVAAAARNGTALAWEGRATALGDHLRWIHIAASPRVDGGSNPVWDGLLMDVSAQKWAENEVRESRRRLRELSAHLEEVKEAERAEVAREVHDDLGGLLTGLRVDVAWLRRHAALVPGADVKIDDMDELANRMVQGVRRIARALRPAILDQGLVDALEWLTRDFRERTGLACRFSANAEAVALESGPATSLFRAVQECLTNVSRHAQATEVEVQLFVRQREVSVEVRDNGRGLAATDRQRAGSFGLRSMEERIRHLDGWVDVSGEAGRGTTVMLMLPLPARAEEVA